MKLIAGLGNPGAQYEGTRHNMGFKTIEKFADLCSASFDREGFKGIYGIVKNPLFPEPVIIVKPQTFMNLSGDCVRPLADYFKITIDDLIIVYDDMALPEGAIRLRENGSSGGHKGMQNIIDHYASEKIRRIRVGISEPENHDTIDYVLGKPKGESLVKIEDATDRAAKALRDILVKGFPYAMSIYNGKEDKPG
jgi:PTH1 family peptidyl-tRNA hydrolase